MEMIWIYSLVSLFILVLFFKFNPKRNLPPSPARALPFLGHLHLLKFPLHRTYKDLSDKLGPIFSLRLGNRLMVVVSSPALVEECFTKNDVVLADRPRLLIAKYMSYDYTSLISTSYGDHWRNLRRLAAVEVLSSNRLNTFQSIRKDETKLLLQKIHKSSEKDFARVELRHMLFELAFNNIMRMVAGKRYFGEDDNNEDEKELRELIDEVFLLSGASNPNDFFPVFKWIDYKGFQKNLARVSSKLDSFMQGLIDEKRQSKGMNTMIDHLLSLQELQPEYYTDVLIKGIINDTLLAGTDTSSVTIEWAMSVLLNHPEKLDKTQKEIDDLVGNDCLIDESDLSKLPYLQNVISETFRLFPAGPLLVPHESSGDCKVGGYDIPQGTILIVNAWAIHTDPMVWDDPTSFKPERFEIGAVGPPKLMPFGMGRRSCPGIGLAQRVVGLTLGSLIQCFEWRRIDEAMVDLMEGKGLSMPKLVPLEAMCKSRDVLRVVLRGAP